MQNHYNLNCKIRNWIIVVIVIINIFSVQNTTAQTIDQSQISSVNVDNLTDAQIAAYWKKATSQGYTIDQLSILAKAKGMSDSNISKLKNRIMSLQYVTGTRTQKDTIGASISSLDKFGLAGNETKEIKKNPLFGFDFFGNPNISFTPNINLATPATYQLGPGDELLIDIWGASENNYRKKIDREGAIRIENIGPIYVSGLPFEKAKEKIISYLKKIYSGIGTSGSNYNKVYADVSLVGVRTVQVNIMGEVKVPGTYSLSALSTVLNALYAAGGPTEKGTFRNIKVIRNGKLLSEFDIYNYLINGSEKGNVMLQDQDNIIVQPYSDKIAVTGQVKRTGIYELKKGETISNLINYFGGFNADAYKDRLTINRVNGREKTVSEIVLKDQPDFELKDGDSLAVGKIIDRYQNRVIISGAVYRPGNYELTNNLTLSDLINKAAGIKDDAFLDRGIIYRTLDDVQQEVIPFSLKQILAKTTDIALKREDSVEVFSKYNLQEDYKVSIDGAINKPKTINFIEKMSVEDLIAIAGGFKEGADVDVIDISRRVVDGSYTTISQNLKRSSSADLKTNGDAFYLQPFDRVSVRYKKGYTTQKNVSISGEVAYPGNYSIVNKDERISDLIEKAGGFSPFANIQGASLIRNLNNSSDKSQQDIFKNLTLNDSLVNLQKETTTFKVGIDLERIMKPDGKKSKYDLILEEGDQLIIPSERQTVEVSGEVLSPTLIRYDKRNTFLDYVRGSGGFSETAKKSRSYVVYANGKIKSTKNFLFFKSYPKVTPGAIILVPKKGERQKMSLQEVLGITTGLSTLGILIKTLFP